LGTIWSGFVVALESALRFFFDLTHSAGFAIILFTLAIKLVLLPLTLRQLRSSREMQKIQPKVRELQKKYKDNREKMNAELMKLYREYGVNPMSGLPIFFGVYYAVLNLSRVPSLTALLSRWIGFQAAGVTGIEIRAGLTPGILANQSFLWMSSMGNPDPWRVMPVLAGVLQLIQQRMMTPRDGDAQQATMNNAMMFMPLMIVFIGWNFPAGPVLYWVTQSLFSVVIQYFISGWGALTDWLPFLPERKQPEPKPRPKPVQVEASPAPARGWFARLVDRMTTLQEEMAVSSTTDEAEDQPLDDQEASLPPAPSKRRSRR
jgi:YidC/Oxa1 family membrane protein insertase